MANNSVAYGFMSLTDLYNQRVAQAGPERVYTAIQESAAEYSRIVNGLMSLIAAPTMIAQEQIELPGSGTLQPLDEWGNPQPVLPSGSYQVAYPIQGAGTAFGNNRVTRALMTVEEANRFTVDAMQRDKDWLFRHALAALLTNTTWSYTDQAGPAGYKGLGAITIQPLANADAVTYIKTGTLAAATDDHYLATASAISDNANPFPAIKAELDEHPSNRGPYVAYVATSLVATITGLTEFVDRIDPEGDISEGDDTATVGSPASLLGFGKQVLGKTRSGIWIVEAPIMPAGYMAVFATGADPVLRLREYPAPELQGFFTEKFSPDGNSALTRFIRYGGFGVRNRVGAVIQQIGNGSYQIPTGYSAPLAL